ncbi:MAG: hypothetical protein LBM70_03370 [Victivallales bacterium]|jgi:hypothetical protein|nr:hypothetical protein [Victivallales bacterium]
MVSIAELTKRAEKNAILSSCCGFLGEVTLTDSAVIVLFAGVLGAGDMLTMLTTSVLPLFNGLLIIPMAALVMKYGSRHLICRVLIVSSVAYFFAASSPWFGAARIPVLLGSIVIFALSVTIFLAGWFPLLDTFLTRNARIGFFSRMRFCHQLSAVLFLLLCGLFLGVNPSVEQLQMVLFCAAVIFCGRAFFISRIPEFPTSESTDLDFRTGILLAAGNRNLTGFSVYLFMLNLSVFGTVPLMLLYLKNGLNAPGNGVIFVSSAALIGMLLGYLGIGFIVRRWKRYLIFPTFHGLYFLLNCTLLFLPSSPIAACAVAGVILTAYNFLIAGSSILASGEMMALASPGNKVMAMAFSGAFSYGAWGLSRLISSFLLGSEILASGWSIGGRHFSHYQVLLLIYSAAILFSSIFLVLIPAIFPDEKYLCRLKRIKP